MGRIFDALFGARQDYSATQIRYIGLPSDGGLGISGVNATTALGLSAVWRCIDILCNGVSQLPWIEKRGTLELPSSRLVRQPQVDYTRREWVSLVVATLALYDVCYLYKAGGEDSEGVPIALVHIDPRIISPDVSDTLSILPPKFFNIGRVRVSRDQLVILHRSPQPGISDDLGGVLRLARIKFAESLAADAYASRYWQSGGPTDRALVSPGPMPDSLANENSDRWANRRAKGPDHVPTLTGGMKLEQYGVDPTLQSAVEARREQVADVGRYFGVPTRILNAPTGDSETYTSTAAANMDLVRYTLQNYIGAIEDGISDLLPGGRHMTMDTWRLTSDTQLNEAQAFNMLTGGKAVLDVDEVRERLGYGPVESPDTLNPPAPPPVMVTPGGLQDGNRNSG